jgi:tripartite-type tricarboxylate transporter receptor subunit TctC
MDAGSRVRAIRHEIVREPSMSGIKMIHIPYKGAGAAVTDLLAGRIPVYFMNILQSLSLIKAGKLRALGVTTPQRTPIAPEIPAIAEAGLRGYGAGRQDDLRPLPLSA